MKQIIAKTDMVNDPMVVKIKAFRLLNKRAGEFKRIIMDETKTVADREMAVSQYRTTCAKLQVIAKEMDAAGYKIWVNLDGKTGHTYPKDYKVTDDLTNDFEAFSAEVAAMNGPAQELIDGIDLNDVDPDSN